MTQIDEFYQHSRHSVAVEPIVLEQPVPLEALHTPALILDLDLFEKNLSKMQRYLNDNDIALRAHTKMHKCPEIAKRQIAAGARGDPGNKQEV